MLSGEGCDSRYRLEFSLTVLHLKCHNVTLTFSHHRHMQTWHICTCSRCMYTHKLRHRCQQEPSRHPHFLKQRLDSKPSVTFIMREYLAKRLTSPSSTSAPFGRCIHFSEPAMNISGLSDRSSEEWKERRNGGWVVRVGREVQGGMGNHIWFCRSHKWLKPCRFQSDSLSPRLLHRFPSAIALSLSLHFPLPSCRYGILQVYDEPRKKKKTLMVARPNFTVPLWVCVGRNPDKFSLSHPGSFIPQLPYSIISKLGSAFSKLSATSEGMQNRT